MARILEIQKKSNEWLAQFGANVTRVLQGNEMKILALNKSNMLTSLDAQDKPLIHSRTKSAYLSKAYAKRKGKNKPNLYDRGNFQLGMFLTIPNEKEYIISSDDEKVNFLQENYGKIFGVSPKNQPKAFKINDPAIINDYLTKVFR